MDIKSNREFYHGIYRLDIAENGVRPIRFTDAETEVYSVSEARRTRAAGGAGELIALRTDADEIVFDFDVLGIARRTANFAYFVDGIMQKVVEVAAPECGRFTASIPLGGGLHIVEIYLPHLVEIEIHSIDVRGGEVCEALPKKEQIYLAYGDSITQGMESKNPAAIYAVTLARELDMELYNFGVGGATFDPNQVQSNGHTPTLVTAMYGINDLIGQKLSIDELRANVREFCRRLTSLYPTAKIYVISPLWTADKLTPRKFGTFDGFCDEILEVGREFQSITFIDGRTLVPNSQDYFLDAVHPNELGFASISLKLYRILHTEI